MMNRISLSTDLYQESHLISPTAGWSKTAYLMLSIFTGIMASIIFIQKDMIIAIPLLGKIGYLFFQLLTGGVSILGLYHFVWGGTNQQSTGLNNAFSWSGFFIRDLFMGILFTAFPVLISRIILSEDVKISGVFADFGGWEALMDPATPLFNRIVLGGIALILGGVILLLAFIPVWMLYRAFLNLLVIARRGKTKAMFSQTAYAPGASLDVKIRIARPGDLTKSRRVFLNYLQANKGEYPPSSKKYKRSYIHTEFRDFSIAELQSGITFKIPTAVADYPVTSDHKGNNKVRYWEILMEEPKEKHWARFFILVK